MRGGRWRGKIGEEQEKGKERRRRIGKEEEQDDAFFAVATRHFSNTDRQRQQAGHDSNQSSFM